MNWPVICCWHKVVLFAAFVSCPQTAVRQVRPRWSQVSSINPHLQHYNTAVERLRRNIKTVRPLPPPSLCPSLCHVTGSPRRGPVIGGEQHLSREPVTTGDPDWPLRTWPCRVRPTWIELLCARAYICMRRRVAAATVAVQSKHKRQRKVSAFLSVCDDALEKSPRVCRLSCGKCSIFWLSWDFVFV